MKAAKTCWFAGLVLVAGLSSASCGKEEAAGGGTGGTGTVFNTAGNAGSGGKVNGRGGSSGTAGTGGTSTASPSTALGKGCVNDAQCVDKAAPGLTCVTATSAVLGDGAPPKGLCTKECTLPSADSQEDECGTLVAGSICYPFTSGAKTGYCVEGCAFGQPGIGEEKCHSRPEFACNPALLGTTDSACAMTSDCQDGELCIDGACNVVFPACLPACRGDIDCEKGMYCDQSFLNGVCVAKKPTGKTLGEPCTVPAAGEPNEPDECLGFCQDDDGVAKTPQGHCATTCGLATQCSWNSSTQKYDGVCFYASVLTQTSGDTGDFGFCTPTCNCTAECNDSALACSLLTQGALSADFRGPGLCFSPDAKTAEYNQCTGAGGSDAGGSGAGGNDSTGAAGMPTAAAGNDGAGGAGAPAVAGAPQN